ncbi:MAG TPA: hypothetical protein VNA20_01165 [Frankiaceae bacterium]|nr:hypothetical protein [Frankiaceae bacterium]
MRRILLATTIAAASLGGFGGSANALCAANALCTGQSNCYGTVNVCPNAWYCSGTVNVCPGADTCTGGGVNVCDFRVPTSR